MNALIGTTTRELTFVLLLFSLPLITPAATVSWDGGGGNNSWHTAANWGADNLPGASDDFVIDAPDKQTITFSTGSATVRSLRCEEAFQLSGGTLTVAADASFVHGTLQQPGDIRI